MANLKDLIVNGAARIIGKTYSSEFVGNVTGDLAGNAATSSKLKTARSLKITDDGTNTSTGVDFDGSDAVTLKLPSTIKATFSGNLTGDVTGNVSGSSGSCTGNAATATKATNDSADQQIDTTYIKGLSVDGRTITYTKGNDSTGTITTQDTTYSSLSAASGGTDVSLVTTGEKYTWNSKADGSHPHGNITNAGAIGNAADKLVATTTNGVLTAATTLAATSLAAGSTPTVSLSSGTLTFGIPKGDKGDTGPAGPSFTVSSGSGDFLLLGISSSGVSINNNNTKCSGVKFNGSNLYASGFYVSSLRSLKENIEPTKVKAVDLINSQEIVDFNYKADADKARKIGLIADDSDPLFLDKKGETVDLYNTCGILMKAVQELSKRVKELEQKLK